MALPGAIDTLLVLAGLYAGLSVVCSFVNETVCSFFQLRGRTLYKGILTLFLDSKELADALYAHPLVGSGSSDATAAKSLPSYIDARNFSTAFLQTVSTSLAGEKSEAALAALTSPALAFADLERKIAALGNATVPGALVANSKAQALAKLEAPLRALVVEADGDYRRLLEATDAWFDRQMDRVSGWYRRNAQWNLVAIGVILAFGFGIDSIHIASRLYAGGKIRGAIADRLGADYQRAQADPVIASAPNADVRAARLAQLLEGDLDDVPLSGFVDLDLRDFFWKRFTNVHAFLGALVTALAISLGAPFWFDVLGGLVNVRMSGAKPDDVSPPAPPPKAPVRS